MHCWAAWAGSREGASVSNARIVTDSSAELAPDIVQELGITVVPWRVHLGSETRVDGPALRSAEYHRETVRKRVSTTVVAPTTHQFSAVYSRLARETDHIISIHPSSSFGTALRSADAGRMSVLGRCDVNVIDSQFISRALGLLVIEAAKAAWAGVSGPEIVRLVHGLIPRMYFGFHVDTMDYLKRNDLVRDVRDAASGLARSLLMLENGEIVALRRSRSRGTPVERLVEFSSEFRSLSLLAILHTGLREGSEEIKTQLAESMPHQAIEEHIYGPVLAAYIGPTALGIVVFEE